MADKDDIRLVRGVSSTVQRVFTGLAGSPMYAAQQIDPETRCIETFRDMAWEHADMLEREARNIRNAVSRFHADTRSQNTEGLTDE